MHTTGVMGAGTSNTYESGNSIPKQQKKVGFFSKCSIL